MKLFRYLSAALAVALMVGAFTTSQDAGASGRYGERTVTIPQASGGFGQSVIYSPASQCLGTDYLTWLFLGYDGLLHANRSAGDRVHVITELDLGFSVRNFFAGQLYYEGRGHLSIDEFIEVSEPGQGYVSRTLPVDMVAPDGSILRLFWTVPIRVEITETTTYIAVSWWAGLVSCA